MARMAGLEMRLARLEALRMLTRGCGGPVHWLLAYTSDQEEALEAQEAAPCVLRIIWRVVDPKPWGWT